MQRLLECPICINYYETTARIPKTLLCGHSFCVECLNDLVTGTSIRCPTCRKCCELPQGRVNDLPTSFAILDLLDTACEECRDQPQTTRCSHCTKQLCHKCHTAHSAGSPSELIKDLENLQVLIAKLKEGSEDEAVLNNINIQRQKTAANISDAFHDWIMELQHQKTKLISRLKAETCDEEERLQKWRSDASRLLLKAQEFVVKVSVDKLKSDASPKSKEELASAIDECKQKKDQIESTLRTRPCPATFNLRASKHEFDNWLSSCAEVIVSKSGASTSSVTTRSTPYASDSTQNTGTIPEYGLATFKDMWRPDSDSVAEMWWPWGIAMSPTTQDIFVTDYISRSAQVHSKDLKLAFKLNNMLSTIQQPFGVAVNKAGKFFMTDHASHCVYISDEQNGPAGGAGKFGYFGKQPGQFSKPSGLAIDSDGLLYVCDSDNLRVQVLHSDGTFLHMLSSDKLFTSPPFFIAVSSRGIVAITDLEGNLHILTTKGHHLRSIRANVGPHLINANGVAFDDQGNILIADQSGCLKVLQNDGQYICSVGGRGRAEGQLLDPRGILVRDDGEIVVCDMGNQRIQVFEVPKLKY